MKRFSIVGADRLNALGILAGLNDGVTIVLVREPDNKFDAFAVMVWADGKHVGYVPKKQNRDLAALIDSKGRKWTAPQPVLALDQKAPDGATVYMALDAKFVRSPNSGFPMAAVEA